MRAAAERAVRRSFAKQLVTSGDGWRIWHWPAMPPEAPVESYSVTTTDPSIYGSFPTLQQAKAWATSVRCPLMARIHLPQCTGGKP